jgi:hypothetical protein
MTTPETPPPGGDDSGRGLSGVQRAGIVLGALGVLLIAFVIFQGGDDSGSPSSSAPQTTATQRTTTTTAETTASGSTSTDDSTTGSTTDDNGSGGSGSDDSRTETATTQTTPPTPAVPTIRIVNGQPQGGVEHLKFAKGDRVRFKVQSDVADEVHVHGYDLMKDVSKGGSVSFSFPATIEGRFEVELEHAGTQIAELEVEPS